MAMPQTVTLTLRAGANEATTGHGELVVLSTAARLGRAGVVMVVALVLAVLLVPIPIVHLVGIPLVLLIGTGVAMRQFLSVARLARVRLHCPKCGEPNHLGGGMGFRTAAGPIAVQCVSCRRPLELSWTARA